MKRIYHLTIIIWLAAGLCCPTHAQAPAKLLFSTGSPAPTFSLEVTDTLGKPMGKNANTDFYGKWLILDFWTRSCIACISSMPKLSGMQREFSAKANFLLVGKNDPKYNERIKSLYLKIAKSEDLRLFTAFDTASFKTFRVQATPHVVIIDPKGSIYAVTYSEELTRKNLTGLFEGKPVDFAPMRGFENSLKKTRTITAGFLGERQPSGANAYSSTLSYWKKTDPMLLRLDLSETAKRGEFFTNTTTLERLYLLAYYAKADWDMSDSLYATVLKKVMVGLKSDSLFQSNRLQEKGLFNYRLKLRDTSATTPALMMAMQQDLKERFGFRAEKKMVETTVYELKVADSELISQLRSRAENKEVEGDPSGYRFKGIHTSELLAKIGYFHPKLIFRDQTGIGFAIDVSLSANMFSMEEIRTELSKIGLAIVPVKAQLQVLEISGP